MNGADRLVGRPGAPQPPAGGTPLIRIPDYGTAVACKRCGAYRDPRQKCPRCQR